MSDNNMQAEQPPDGRLDTILNLVTQLLAETLDSFGPAHNLDTLITGLEELLVICTRQKAARATEDEHLGQLMEHVVAIAALDFSSEAPLTGEGDIFDAVATGLNALGEELRTSTVSKNYLDSILQSMMDAVIVTDDDTIIQTVNQATLDLLGYAAHELVGQPISLILASQSSDLISQQPTIDLTGNIDTFLQTRDSVSIPVSLAISSMNTTDYSKQGFVFVARDISELQQAHEQIRRLNDELELRVLERTAQLENANRELDAFAYAVSHDLRAPLRGINGFSQAVLEDYEDQLDAEGQDYLKRIIGATGRMNQLIADLLKLSRITRADIQRETVNLSNIVRDSLAQLQTQEPERMVELQIAEDIMADGDPHLLQVVCDNLLGNAWKFTRKNAQSKIEFDSYKEGNHLVYIVRDNGAGFDMTYANKLFGAFQRLHGETEFEGTGIGLATVQRIIHRHGGTIRAEGAVNMGATFYFTL